MLTTVTCSRAVHCKAMTSQQLCNCHITRTCNTYVKTTTLQLLNTGHSSSGDSHGREGGGGSPPDCPYFSGSVIGSAPSSPTAATAVQAATVVMASPAVTNPTIRRNLAIGKRSFSFFGSFWTFAVRFYLFIYFIFVYFFDVHSTNE